MLIAAHMILEQAEHLPVGPLGVRTEVTATLQIGVDGLSQRGEIFVGPRLPAEESMLATMAPGVVVAEGPLVFRTGKNPLSSPLLAGPECNAGSRGRAVGVVELGVIAPVLVDKRGHWTFRLIR